MQKRLFFTISLFTDTVVDGIIQMLEYSRWFPNFENNDTTAGKKNKNYAILHFLVVLHSYLLMVLHSQCGGDSAKMVVEAKISLMHSSKDIFTRKHSN